MTDAKIETMSTGRLVWTAIKILFALYLLFHLGYAMGTM